MAEFPIACPHCGRLNQVHSEPGGATPRNGDAAVCWACGGVSVFTDDGFGQRSATSEEIEEFMRDDDFVKMLDAMRVSPTPAAAIARRRIQP